LSEAVTRAGENGQVSLYVSDTIGNVEVTILAERSASHSLAISENGSLAISLADTLAGLQGLALRYGAISQNCWSAAVSFDRANQRDFFSNSSAI
jgi:hypothetical protein